MNTISSRLAVLVTGGVLLAAVPVLAKAGGGGTVWQTVISTSSPAMPQRLFRDGAPSACGIAKPYPGVGTISGAYSYETLGGVKVAAAGCVTFTIQIAGTCPVSGVHLTAYDGMFNPGNLALGYLGDSGTSATTAQSQAMAINLALNQNVALIVSSSASGSTGPCTVTVNTLDVVTKRPFTVFVGEVPSTLPPLTYRLYRDAVRSSCDTPKFFPGTNPGPADYFRFAATAPASACARITASLAGAGCGTDRVHASAYNGLFDPGIISINYLGDTGSAAFIGTIESMSIIVGPEDPVTLVANQISNTATSPCTISLSAFDLVNDQLFASGFGG